MSNVTFAFRRGVKGVDPQAVGERLMRMEAVGPVTPVAVVEEARSESSPFHAWFEWDDSVAAEEYRLEQARRLVRNVVVVSRARPDSTVRAFVHVRAGDEEDVGYVETERALSSVSMRALVLGEARRDMRVFRDKYRHLRELDGVLRAMDAVLGEGLVGVA